MDPESGEHLTRRAAPALLRAPPFRLFTKESLTRIQTRIQQEKAAHDRAKELQDGEHEEKEKEEDKPRPDSSLEVGKKLPAKMGDIPPELYGKPIEDLDEFYDTKYTFMVVGKDKSLYRFSATNANFCLSPFNPVRRAAIYVLCHPAFGLFVMLVILVNCVFMASKQDNKIAEGIFTGIYTVEGLIKIVARGFILKPFTYLRDMWNWLDFVVVSFAYITMLPVIDLGNVSALRTARVLRALKTVAVVPGLKTIVGALLEAVIRLRDVMILSVFILAIFALVGLQVYQGTLTHKCVSDGPYKFEMPDAPWEEKMAFYSNMSNWLEGAPSFKKYKICGNSSAERCPLNYTCRPVGPNPDYGYTNFDNFGWAMLCAFRLMTQDYWENLYQLIIRANGPFHMVFFVIVILLGSFYLLNLILAIVAMSYDEQQKQDQDDEDAEEEELLEQERFQAALREAAMMAKTPTGSYCSSDQPEIMVKSPMDDKERISIKSECGMDRRLSIVTSKGRKVVQPSLSLPGSPYTCRRGSKDSKFSWRRRGASPRSGDRQPLVLPWLSNLNLPYADDSAAVTPTSEDLCNPQNTQSYLGHRRRLSSTSYSSKLSHLESRFVPGSHRSSFASHQSRRSFSSFLGGGELPHHQRERVREPTHFHWNVSFRHRQQPTHPHSLNPEIIVDKTKSDDNESSSSGSECETAKVKLFPDNPFICRTPSAAMVEMQEILVLQDLIDDASGRRKKSFLSCEAGMTRKEWLKAKCLQLIFGWECSPCWHRFAHMIELFIMDAFVDMFITLCILVNTMFMSLDHFEMDEGLARTLRYGNYVFTAIFTLEAVLKLIALNPINYCKDKWNCFDIVIVILSLVELPLSSVRGLSILRSFRLLRVFKLAKSWPTLNLLIGIIGRTMGALGNLCFVLGIIVFIFAVMGMQLFGDNYTDENFGGEAPRWNFKNFLHSFMIVFRVLCGEWIESMWDCMHCGSAPLCVPFFLLTMVIGNLVVLNLFLALLLSSFGAESLQNSQDESSEPNKLQEAVDRINRFVLFIKSHIMYCIKVKMGHTSAVGGLGPVQTRPSLVTKETGDGQLPMRNGRVCEPDASDGEEDAVSEGKDEPSFTVRLVKGSKSHVGYSPVSPYEASEEGDGKNGDAPTRPASKASSSTARMNQSYSRDSKLSRSLSSCSKDSKSLSSEASIISDSNFSYSKDETRSFGKQLDNMEGPEINEVKVVFVKYPDECCPKFCVRKCKCCAVVDKTRLGQKWWAFRCYMYKLVEHKYFETFIIAMILASSLALAVEDINLPSKPTLELILNILDRIFTFVFILEMLLKWAAYGFKKYFTDAWCWLDFIIVAISLIMLGAEGAGYGEISAFRALRTLRALRPLRAVSRWEGMKVVVNALIQAVPSIANVLLVCLVFWLIFSIMGVQLFGGRFYKCLDPNGDLANDTFVPNKSVCVSLSHENYTWNNSLINFDNAGNGYLALFQVATFKGWVSIMDNAVDSKVEATFKGWTPIMADAINSKADKYLQPYPEVRVYMYLYFVFFIVFGSFFTLNLFIGVIIDNFNMQKKKMRGSLEMFMTDDQKKYYNAMKKLGSKAPQKPIPKPRFKCQLFFFKLTTNQKFDIGIMSVILLNMLTMALEHYQMDMDFKNALSYINLVFIAIFTLECVMKILGLRWYYFKQPWNVFDFIVVVLSILGLAMVDLVDELFVSPTLLRVVRVFRVGRVLRLVKSAKGIRTLLFSLAVSLPALFNIGLLLFLVMFIYSVFGMNFFMHVKHTQGLTDMFNFETFGRSMIVLFQISTSAGWDSILAGLMNESDCTDVFEEKEGEDKKPSNCGSQPAAVMYLITYLVISFLVVINMYIAVILENFSQATEDVQQGLTQDDFDMYYEIWEKFDEEASQYIPFTRLEEFVDTLEEPLNIPLPNHFKLVNMDIPICEDDRVHCVDILDALTKNFLGTGGDPTSELGDIKKGPDRPNYNPVSTTRLRQREILCAKIIQKAWRDYAKRRTDQPRVHCVVDIVKIEEEDEEENTEHQQHKDEEEKKDDEKENPDKDKDMMVEGETGEASIDTDDSRTVELYPESGVVA